ncbi:MAG TPA: hypothetical protein DHV28_09350 [Ignavibacteriales bacterium]|nr:MAG: hypothetical protein A2057_01645 [Ignavibacteria bacterium GWA2_35_9]OGU36584.1 MAG: hypothetical protein A2068_09860 [Ignavibacteria bacterium GWB2_35_6b]OGU52595.1 MAG: hypothetical protein A2080_04815 [Ignavibacteria bacterium GWC2_36_12]OGV26453.1 MAG: hypothetical protein A3J84_06170 [Ignavibacteria bacterium RIFOXYA2_FULL_37_17]HCY76112.1 hypothetical protein [Ignavibacteriales bacterium]
MKKIFSFILLIIFVGFVFGFTNTSLQEEEPAGKKIFIANKCVTCHSVKAEDLISNTKLKNVPDLSDVGTRRNADFIMKFITKKEKLNNKLHMIAFKGSDEDLQTLAKWLETLKPSEVK